MSTPKLVFIIPYRDREQQLAFFKRHMTYILEDYAPNECEILILHQVDKKSFNRGAMKNIGFLVVKQKYPTTYHNITLVFNDVDTMPFTKGFFNYETRPKSVKHFYGYTHTLGGIVCINTRDFELINGFINLYAWGYEDNNLNTRVLNAGIMIDRSVFYPILDKNVIHLQDGIKRLINKGEFDKYKMNVADGVSTIHNLNYSVETDAEYERVYMVNVHQFSTLTEEDTSKTVEYDLQNGNTPFKTSRMNMIFS